MKSKTVYSKTYSTYNHTDSGICVCLSSFTFKTDKTTNKKMIEKTTHHFMVAKYDN